MLTNENPNQSTNYTRLNNDIPIYPSLQAQGPSSAQNQVFNQQAFANITQQALMAKYASQLRCLCLTILIQNIIFIIFNIIYYGSKQSVMFIIMIVEAIGASIYLFRIRKGQVYQHQFISARNTYIYICLSYVVYIVIMIIIAIVEIHNINPDNDQAGFILVFFVYSVGFLVPRFVVLCVAGKKIKRY